MSENIQNARITGADIVFSRGFILDCWVFLEFEGGAQGFGGYALGGNPFDTKAKVAEHDRQPNLAADFIGGVMAVADVEKFSELKGKVLRVERESPMGSIVAIGHAFKDKWYRPAERFEMLNASAADRNQ